MAEMVGFLASEPVETSIQTSCVRHTCFHCVSATPYCSLHLPYGSGRKRPPRALRARVFKSKITQKTKPPQKDGFWRRRWDLNPRARFADNTISNRARYDHFDTSP